MFERLCTFFFGREWGGKMWQTCTFFPPFPPHYQIKIDNCKDERTVALLENPKTVGAWWAERLWLSDFRFFFFFPLLLMIASIVWRASCGKCSTHRYHTHAYYPWQKEWDEIIVKELLLRSLQEGCSPCDWRRLDNFSRVLVVWRWPITSFLWACVEGKVCCVLVGNLCYDLRMLFTSGSFWSLIITL